MLYNHPDLNYYNYPDDNVSLVDICRIAVLPDELGAARSIVRHLADTPFKIDMLKEDSDVVLHFRRYHPDALMFCSDHYANEFIGDLTLNLRDSLERMPILIEISFKLHPDLQDLYRVNYFLYYHIFAPYTPRKAAYHLKRFLLTRAISSEYYIAKVRECIVHTLIAMKCGYDMGFDNMVDLVCKVILNPYRRFSKMELYKEIGSACGINYTSVITRMKKITDKAYEQLSEPDRKLIFPDDYGREDFHHDPVDFIYAAARLTAIPCRDILRILQDQPLYSVNSYRYDDL